MEFPTACTSTRTEQSYQQMKKNRAMVLERWKSFRSQAHKANSSQRSVRSKHALSTAPLHEHAPLLHEQDVVKQMGSTECNRLLPQFFVSSASAGPQSACARVRRPKGQSESIVLRGAPLRTTTRALQRSCQRRNRGPLHMRTSTPMGSPCPQAQTDRVANQAAFRPLSSSVCAEGSCCGSSDGPRTPTVGGCPELLHAMLSHSCCHRKRRQRDGARRSTKRGNCSNPSMLHNDNSPSELPLFVSQVGALSHCMNHRDGNARTSWVNAMPRQPWLRKRVFCCPELWHHKKEH